MNLPTDQARRLVERSFAYAACDELEYVLLSRITRENLNRYIEITGIERLEDVLRSGRGAILYSGHVRGHYLFFAALGLLGFRPNVVGVPVDADLPKGERRRFEKRDRLMQHRMGCKFQNMQDDDFVAVRALRALGHNEVVTFEIDHTHARGNLATDFMGRRAIFPVGPLHVARATQAPLLPFWLHRSPEWTPQIAEIGQPISVSSDLMESLARVVRPLEENVRRHPESWATWLFPDFRLFVESED